MSIVADASGFTVTNESSADATVLVTLMAKVTDAGETGVRENLLSLTSSEVQEGPLWVPAGEGVEAYPRLWQDDVDVRERRTGGWQATRSGAVVLSLHAGQVFRLSHDPAALRLGVVVVAVAAIGAGVEPDAPLTPVDSGPWAVIGQEPGSGR